MTWGKIEPMIWQAFTETPALKPLDYMAMTLPVSKLYKYWSHPEIAEHRAQPIATSQISTTTATNYSRSPNAITTQLPINYGQGKGQKQPTHRRNNENRNENRRDDENSKEQRRNDKNRRDDENSKEQCRNDKDGDENSPNEDHASRENRR